MRGKGYKDPEGGLTAKGREHYKRTEGASLKPGVRNYESASPADKKRWVSWALRFYNRKDLPPMQKNGKPTRMALTAKAWGHSPPKNELEARAIASLAKRRQQQLGKGDK